MKWGGYPECRDSGVPWIGSVPSHWQVERVKDIASIINGFPFDAARFSTDLGHPLVRIRDLNSDTTEARFNGDFVDSAAITSSDVLIGMDGDFNIGRWRGHGAALLNQRMCCLRGHSKSTADALAYALAFPLKAINDITYSTTVKHLSSYQIAKIRVAVPPHDELHAILRFLDSETAKLDAMITKQQRLIELLQEKRQVVISHAVTKGLNPNAPMKDSGVDWLGAVPAHWEVLPTKRLFRLVVEPAPSDNQYELLSIYTDIGVRPRRELEEKGNKASTTDGYFRVKKRDFIVNKLLAWMGAIGLSQYDGVTSPAYDILRARRSLDERYFDYLWRCGICFTEFRRHSRGIMDMRLRLYFEDFGQLLMPYPPEHEQRSIVEALLVQTAQIDTLVAKSQRSIDLMFEHRSALIFAAVTGKIDVRDSTNTLAA